jgi:microcystin-dependent protein
MALESANYVNGLNSANPPAGDPVTQADDHLRLIKAVLQASFPNVNAAVTATPAQINTAAPTGLISLWYGSTASIPTGWALCNGGTYAKQDGSGNLVAPDLRGLFVAGAGGSLTVGQTGGASSVTPTVTVASYTLTTADIPSHNHTVTDAGHGHGVTDPGHFHTNSGFNGSTASSFQAGASSAPYLAQASPNTSTATTGISVNSATSGITLAATGGNGGHTHTATSSTVGTIPPYLALAYIIKL